jgi:hypothetical protein
VRRVVLVAWVTAAVAGSVGVWWLSSYLETLTALAETDRGAALALFRTRVIPALLGLVALAVAAGAFLLRQGLQIARGDPEGRLLGRIFAVAGFLVAAVPLVFISIVFWVLRRA